MSIVRTLIGNIKGPKGDTGDTGATGATGANGADGAAATIQVGTVTTSAYGTTAQVTNSGTESAAVFDFVIPQGKPGEETTRMSGLTLDQITAQSATYPIPAVGESGATIWGKVVKFFNDCKTALASKVNVSDIVNNLTSTVTNKPLSAAQGKTLNDAIASLNTTVNTINIKSLARVAAQVTTGSTGNINTAISNDGLTYVLAPFVNTNNHWRAYTWNYRGSWYIKIVNADTGDPIANTEVALRYIVLKLVTV